MRTIEKIKRDCDIASGMCFDISDSEIEAAQVRLSQDIPDLLAAMAEDKMDYIEEAKTLFAQTNSYGDHLRLTESTVLAQIAIAQELRALREIVESVTSQDTHTIGVKTRT